MTVANSKIAADPKRSENANPVALKSLLIPDHAWKSLQQARLVAIAWAARVNNPLMRSLSSMVAWKVSGERIWVPLNRQLKVRYDRPHANGLPPKAATPTEKSRVATNSLIHAHQKTLVESCSSLKLNSGKENPSFQPPIVNTIKE